MDLGYCHLSVVPVRAEPAEQSEMTTQLLFGDIVQIVDTKKNWCKIKCMYDNYSGWIEQKQFVLLSNTEYSKLLNNPLEITLDLVQLLIINGKEMMPIVLGSSMPFLHFP